MSANRNVTVAARQLGPFAIAGVVGWTTVLIGTRVNWTEYGISVIVLALSLAYGVVTGMRGRMLSGTALGSLGCLAAVALARESVGGSVAGIGILSLLPVFQTALYVRDRVGLWIVLTGVAVFYLAPLVLIGAPHYPSNGYRGALLAVGVSSIVGLVTHRLVADIRARASEARRRELILVRISELVQQLYRSVSPRRDACRALQEVSEALYVGLYEPDLSSGALVQTTSAADDPVAPGRVARRGSIVCEVFTSKRPRLICDDVEAHVGNVAAWRAAGAPSAVLYQPLLSGNQAVGVLFAGWAQRVAPGSTPVVVASLLSREIAAVIDRADEIEQLTDEALTDSLTGLPNRRAWDMQIARAIDTAAEPVAVVMFDIDRFKRFNDTHGHPAGDRLLREAAAAWRSEIRSEDFLARLGGEEFALLLTGKDADCVQKLVERLRTAMPADQTCSAGIALRLEGDTPEQLLARADRALYMAKESGRDRAVFTGPTQLSASAPRPVPPELGPDTRSADAEPAATADRC